MARPTMKTKIELPGGVAPGPGIECTLRLIAADVGEGVGYVTGSDVTIGGTRHARPDSDGVVSFSNVRPNSGSSDDVITSPANTVYELTTRYPSGRKTVETFVAPDTAGTFWIQDYATPAPTDLPALMAATAVTFTPTGDLAATTVAAALAELDSDKLPKAGGTMTGPLFVDDWTETTGETPDGWPLVPFADATHRPPLIFTDADGFHWAAYEHRGHVVFAILDTAGVTPAGANAWVPVMTIGSQAQNGITFPSAWRFNNDPTAQGAVLNPIDSGIRTGNGTGERLTSGPSITRAVNNADVMRTTEDAVEILAGTQLEVPAWAPGRPVVGASTMLTLPGVGPSTVTTVALAANRRHFMPIYVFGSPITVDQLVFEVTTAVGGSTARVGILNASESWAPTAVVYDSGELSTASTGVVTHTIASPVELAPGPHLLVFQPTAAITVRVLRGTPMNGPIDPAIGASPFATYLYKNTMTGALDTTAPDTTANGGTGFNYMVALRIADPTA